MPIGVSQSRPTTGWGRVLAVAPLIIVPVLVYNFIALMSGPGTAAALAGTVIDMGMLSGARLVLTWGDMLLVLAIVFLFAEVLKSTGTGATAITNHMLSMGLFIICLIEFLLLENFATSVFFLLTAIVLLDALAGMVVSTISARRDFGVNEGFSQ
jgi:hypothetical protein